MGVLPLMDARAPLGGRHDACPVRDSASGTKEGRRPHVNDAPHDVRMTVTRLRGQRLFVSLPRRGGANALPLLGAAAGLPQGLGAVEVA